MEAKQLRHVELLAGGIRLGQRGLNLRQRLVLPALAMVYTLLQANARYSPIEVDAAEATVYGKVVTILRRL